MSEIYFQVHLLASRRECQSEEERALRASREADVARNELALLKETALSARREAETAQEEARIAGAALEAVKRRLEGMVTNNRVGGGRANVLGDGEKTEGSLVGVLERVLANLEGGEGSEEIAGVKEELRGLEERVSEKEERVKGLEERLRGAKESVAAEEAKLKVLRKEARSMAEGVGKKRGQKVDLEEQCGDMQNQVKTLTEKVKGETAHLQKVKAEVKAATDEMERVKERVSTAESKLDSVKEETAQAKQVYRRVKEEVREAKLDLSKTRHELNDLERRWMGLKLEVTGTRNSVNKLDLLSRFKPGGLSSSLPEPLGSTLRTISDDAKRTAVRTSDPAEALAGRSKPHDNQTDVITDSGLPAQRELAGPSASATHGFATGKRHRPETKMHETDDVRTASETRQGERAVSGATVCTAEAQLRVAQNGLEQLLSEMHNLQQRVAHVSESDVSRTSAGRQASETLETLAEGSLAACLEGVRQVHAQLREACASVAPEGALRSGKADVGRGESWRTRPEQGLRRDAELWALEEVCGQMRKDLRRLAERNEVLQQVLRCGSGPPGGVDLAARVGGGGTGCSARRPCEKCVSLNGKVSRHRRVAAMKGTLSRWLISDHGSDKKTVSTFSLYAQKRCRARIQLHL
jgi:myosin heavy subunit